MHDIFWHVVSTGYFNIYFYLSDFFPWKFIKNLGLPLDSITFKVNGQADRYLP